jgi:hypothetical protein
VKEYHTSDGVVYARRSDALDAGAGIEVLDRCYIDLETPMGRGFMAMMSALAEDERQRIIKRTHEGRQIARQGRQDGAQTETHRAPEARGHQAPRQEQGNLGRDWPELQCQRVNDFEACTMTENKASREARTQPNAELYRRMESLIPGNEQRIAAKVEIDRRIFWRTFWSKSIVAWIALLMAVVNLYLYLYRR